jgi:hypothetical protein
LAFEIPFGFVDIINDAALSLIDVYWNETLICRGATVEGIAGKQEMIQGQPAGMVWILTLGKERTPADLSYPSVQKDVMDSGDLRLHALQLALPSGN